MGEFIPQCARDDLHLTGAIHRLGALLAVDLAAHCISHCSANIDEWLASGPTALLGQAPAVVFGDDWAALAAMARDSRCRVSTLALHGRRVSVVAHRFGGFAIFEFEEEVGATLPEWTEPDRIDFVAALAAVETPLDLAALLVTTIARRTGYDRVMVYRFREDWSGEVIAQHCVEGMEGFLGQRFPAGDIPPNARRLYGVNWHRLIADTEGGNVELLAMPGATAPLDLTHAVLRSVHPAHIDYLRNMGVRAAFSLSLLVDGRLWGLVTCHHRRGKRLSAIQRLALEEMARIASLHLTQMTRLAAESERVVLRERLASIHRTLDPAHPDEVPARQIADIQHLFAADSIRVRWQDRIQQRGELPDDSALAALDRWLAEQGEAGIVHYDRLPESLAAHASLGRRAAGALYIRVECGSDILALRAEQVEEVVWAGTPTEWTDAAGAALTPRRSFAAWNESVRNRARPWGAARLAIADDLRAMLAEFVYTLRHTEMAYQDPLTGLANRNAFDRAVHSAINECVEVGARFALHMIDLDRFKPVNDRFGHATGDAVLRNIARRLTLSTRSDDLVARLGGDEFAVIQRALGSVEEAAALAQRLTAAVEQPTSVDDAPAIQVGASVGTAIFPDDACDPGGLFETADARLYAVKGQRAHDLER